MKFCYKYESANWTALIIIIGQFVYISLNYFPVSVQWIQGLSNLHIIEKK